MDEKQFPEALIDLWDSLTDEQKEGARACTTFDELMEYVGELGIELPDEVLDGVAGGYTYYDSASRKYEVINDVSGDVIRGGYVTLENAQTNARYAGQKPDLLDWNQLSALRRSTRRKDC